ncbi:MAG: flagellar hook-associated protein FlgL [Gallionella sp.]|nr:flagellar hook-associated protein FlgL [Gallionella sp.]
MRVSSSTFFETNVTTMQQQQARMLQLQQQVASGRRLLTASDDPVAASRALDISQADAMNTQFGMNRIGANHALSMAESVLQSVTTLIQDVQTSVISAGNASYSNADRKTLAGQLSGRLQELIGLANSTDGTGNFLFSGFQSKVSPFSDSPAGVSYFGDDGLRQMQVSAGRQMPVSVSGADVFMRIKTGNGTVQIQPTATNAGTGVVGANSVVNPAAITGDNYQIAFSVVAGVTTYSVTDTTTSAVLSSGNPYTSGQAITFDGIQFDIKGVPADADTFDVVPSVNESLFKTLSNLVTALNAPVSTPLTAAQLSSSLGQGMAQLESALSNVLNTRSSLGVRMNELDALQSTGEDLDLQLKQTLSGLQDVDYNKAISDLTQQQINLTAAQKTFAKVSGMSMFDYM